MFRIVSASHSIFPVSSSSLSGLSSLIIDLPPVNTKSQYSEFFTIISPFSYNNSGILSSHDMCDLIHANNALLCETKSCLKQSFVYCITLSHLLYSNDFPLLKIRANSFPFIF